MSSANTRFSRFAWFFVAYLVVVILFGAWVRIAGAGAGCGNHWPTCNGDVIPQSPALTTIIEFTHRVTSGLCGVLVLVLVWWARRVSRKVFWAALATLFFILVESFIGAVLVKFELVAGDASVSRAIVISLHLVNTMLLLSAASTVAWWSSIGGTVISQRPRVSRGLLVSVLAVLLLTSITGAVTALGDTIFPKHPALDGSLIASVRADVTLGQHFLVRLRILHPLVAVFAAMVVVAVSFGLRRQLSRSLKPGRRVEVLLKSWSHTVLFQLVIGGVNIMLAAPGWLQIVHLFTAQALWLLVWLGVLELWPARAETAADAVEIAAGAAL